MIIIESVKEIRDYLKNRNEVGFVPTMGNLHEGHLSLVNESLKHNKQTIVSIFVNPIQFGPDEDYNKYPRTFNEDIKKLSACGADAVFFPDENEMYKEQKVYITEEAGLSGKLCGKYRPGHFKGVLTVVLKFFNIIRPDRAYFGRKDFQQYILIKKMAEDLNLNIEIIPCSIVRDADGLALSSRNAYLGETERKNALSINKALKEAKRLFKNGENLSGKIISCAESILNRLKIQYIELVEPETLENVINVKSSTVMAIAAYAGSTRLIDNTVLGEDFL